MLAIILFFLCHWFLSLFFHSFFLHRYASHKMYEISKNWERVFYVSTWLVQGSSYLVPRAYGVMHRMLVIPRKTHIHPIFLRMCIR